MSLLDKAGTLTVQKVIKVDGRGCGESTDDAVTRLKFIDAIAKKNPIIFIMPVNIE